MAYVWRAKKRTHKWPSVQSRAIWHKQWINALLKVNAYQFLHILLCAHSNVRVQLNSFKLRRMAVPMTIKMTLQDKLHGPTNVFRQRFRVYLCCGIFFCMLLLIFLFINSANQKLALRMRLKVFVFSLLWHSHRLINYLFEIRLAFHRDFSFFLARSVVLSTAAAFWSVPIASAAWIFGIN